MSCDNKTGGLKETLDEVKGIAKTFRVYSRKTGEYPSEDVGRWRGVLFALSSLFLAGRDGSPIM